jgi:hypothetical protein
MKKTRTTKNATAMLRSGIIVLLLSFVALNSQASLIISNGEVTYDATTDYTSFSFTLTSDTAGETMLVLGFNATEPSRWDDQGYFSVYESHAWTPTGVASGEVLNGTMDEVVDFDGTSGIDFYYVFGGVENYSEDPEILGGNWKLQVTTSENALSGSKYDLSVGVAEAGTVAIPEPAVLGLISIFGGGLFFVRRMFKD